MKKLILASASPQRRKIMKILGLPFSVSPSRLSENTHLTSGCARLVKTNALRKALDVARRRHRGIVIGSDTVVYSCKKRLILKPRHRREARKNLNELMAGPHWVYSGVAVVDARSGRQEVGFEKTKVFMTKISQKAVRRYHQLVSPLDKAGGFDIEGKAALFIPRIEGCYFNVVGLPLALLAGMLKKFGVSVFCFQFLLLGLCHADTAVPQVCHLSDCVTVEAVSKQDDVQRGLMYRTSLGQNKGMLFVFPNDGKESFWMKNMRFNSDIVWISRDGRIVYMGRNIPACRSNPCPVYTPDKEARYVLELNSGYTASHYWEVGDKLDLKGI